MTSKVAKGSIEAPNCIVHRFKERLRGLKVEQLWMVTMRADHSVIREYMICEGEEDSLRFKPRELLRPAIIDEADVIAFVHNHPSGNPGPSLTDIESTAQIKEACKLVGIRLLDSLVITDEDWFSIAHHHGETE